jgi:hypothetical protein
MTSKDDKCRMLHLYNDPRLQEIWRDCLDSLSRSRVIGYRRKSLRQVGSFNDYELYTYVNMGINATTEGPINDDLVCMHSYIYELNPCNASRAGIVRDAKWCKETMSLLRGKIAVVRSNFKRSGNHENANPFLAWMSFTNDDIILYSKIILPDGVMNQLGRAIPEEIQMDICDLVNEENHLNTINTAD